MTTQLSVSQKLGIAIATIGIFVSSAGTSYAACWRSDQTDNRQGQWNTDHPGSDYSNFDVSCSPYPDSSFLCPSVRELACKAACEADDACLAWTYVTTTKHCWLKNAVSNAVSNSTAHSASRFEYNTDRPGYDFATVTTSSAAACSRACVANADCWAWTWVRSTNVCWLKNAAPNASANTNAISGYVDWTCDP